MIAFKKFITVTAIAVFSMVSFNAEDFVAMLLPENVNPSGKVKMQLFLKHEKTCTKYKG